MVTGGIGTSRRPSAAGQAVLERWHAAADATRRGQASGYGGDERFGAYAAALGRAPGAVAVFAAPKKDVVWSSYRGNWQQLPVETHGGSWPWAIAALVAIIFGPMAYIGGVIWLFAAGLGWIGERVLELTAGAALVGVAIWATRRMVPRFAEFDGQVIRQTFIEHDEDPDEYRVVVDDGAGATAWDLQGAGRFLAAADPGDVRARAGEPAQPGGDHRPGRAAGRGPAAGRRGRRAGARRHRRPAGPGRAGDGRRGGRGAAPRGPGPACRRAGQPGDDLAAVRGGPVRSCGSRCARPGACQAPGRRCRPTPGPCPAWSAATCWARARCSTPARAPRRSASTAPGMTADEASLIRLLALVAARLPGLVIRP